MTQPSPEPIRPRVHPHSGSTNLAHRGHPRTPVVPVTPVAPVAQTRPLDVEALVAQIQVEFPDAHIRITGRGRTVRRQAELMADRRRENRDQFLQVYTQAAHITEMDTWVTQHPTASAAETTTAFEEIIQRALANGATVSNHLSDRARDVSIPLGGTDVQDQIRRRMRELGAHVLDEQDAVGGPHWHVDY